MTTNGSYAYESDTPPGSPGAESLDERRQQERFWRSFGKKIRKGARIR